MREALVDGSFDALRAETVGRYFARRRAAAAP